MKIVFFGKCQARALQRMYQALVAPVTRDRIAWIDSRRRLGAEDKERIEQADVLVEQLADFKPRVELSNFTLRARRIVVPVAGAGFLWPFAGMGHPDNEKRYPAYEPYRAEMGDSWLIKQLRRGCTPEEAARLYVELDIVQAGHLDRRYELLMDAQRTRDAATGYGIAPLIERYFREEPLFLTPYHPTLRLSRYLADEFLQRLNMPSEIRDRVQRLMTDSFYFKFALPVHPAAALHFNLAWANETTRYRFFDEGSFTFAEYARRYARCEANADLPRALKAVDDNAPGCGPALEAALQKSPASPWALVGLARVRVREYRYEDAVGLLRRAIGMDEECRAAHLYLAESLAALGHVDKAEHAFRKHLRQRPYLHGDHARFAKFLASQDRIEEAQEAVAHALDLQPGRQAYVALRRDLTDRRQAA